MTRQRAAVLALLEQTDSFVSAQQLHDMLAERGQNVGLATVYRNLTALAEARELDVVRVGEENRYRLCERESHHHHLVCRECGQTVEIQDKSVESWLAELSKTTGFEDISHIFEATGVCTDCVRRATVTDDGTAAVNARV